MKTTILTVENIKTFLLEIVLAKTEKISKVSPNSVLGGLLYSVAKLLQKGMKDSALIESELFPEFAYGEDLDLNSRRQGIGGRLGALGSSTFVKVIGDYGTTYSSEQNIFVTSSGVQFKAVEDWTIPEEGYVYVRVNSLLQGSSMNVPPYTINKLLAPPVGHKGCLNEVMAIGARDSEDDFSFRQRIQNKWDSYSTDTLSKLTQILISLNSSILDVRKMGKTSDGTTLLGVVTQNGVSLTAQQLEGLLESLKNSLSLSDLRLSKGDFVGVELRNIQYTLIDIDFRVELFPESNLDDFSARVQTQISKYLDWRYWDFGKKVEWDELFLIIKSQREIKYIADQYFSPRSDLVCIPNTLPRLNSFVVRNMAGEVLLNNRGTIKSVFYQNYLDTEFKVAVLSNI